MYFHQRHKAQSSFWGRAVLIGLVLLVLVLAFVRPKSLTTFALTLGAPFMEVRTTASTGASFFAGLFRDKDILITENTALKRELESMRLKADLYDHTRRAYEELRALSSGTTPRVERIARVIASPGVAPYDVLIIDIGSDEGVVAGALVFSDTGVALGFVETLGTKSSRVVLFSSPEAEEGATLARHSFPTIAYGHGGGSFVLHIPKDIAVTKGDILTRAGTADVLAFVVEVTSRDTEAFQTVRAATPVNIYELLYVVVSSATVTQP